LDFLESVKVERNIFMKGGNTMMAKKWRKIGLSFLVVSLSLCFTTSTFSADKDAWRPAVEKFKNLTTFKQEVVASNGVVTANNPLASLAGGQILIKGGNAFDAWAATFFALSVAEPMMTTPFGAGFVTLRTKEGEIVTLDNYTVAPAAARPDMYKLAFPEDEEKQAICELNHYDLKCVENGENVLGARAIGVPGSMKAYLWVLKKYGSRKLSLREIMQPAIDYAKNGFRVSPFLSESFANSQNSLKKFPGWAARFMPNGKVPASGELFKQPVYAATLEAIADAAPPGASFDEQLEAAGTRFYKGDIAKNIISYLQANGGDMTLEDLAWYYGTGLNDLSTNQGLRLREPARGTYRGYEIVAMPPASSGGTHLIEMLNILEGFDLKALGFGNPETLSIMAEAMRIAWADRDAYMGDPDYGHKDPSYKYPPPPIKDLISKEYAAKRRKEIQPKKPGTYKPGLFSSNTPESPILRIASRESANTTNVNVIDNVGNMIASTQTANGGFGAGIILPGQVPGSGMVLNNTMCLFDPDPRPGFEKANAIASRKRTLSSMTPTIILKDGKPFMAIGSPGGTKIFSAVLQGIINVIDHGMTVQQAAEAPRIWAMMFGPLQVEQGFPAGVSSALEEMGYTIEGVKFVAGCMTGIMVHPETKLIHGGADWRRDGTAVGWSGGDALDVKTPYPPIWDTPKK
jgi:gamma-glutamyltranspeptidase/glutathione hydrolase